MCSHYSKESLCPELVYPDFLLAREPTYFHATAPMAMKQGLATNNSVLGLVLGVGGQLTNGKVVVKIFLYLLFLLKNISNTVYS